MRQAQILVYESDGALANRLRPLLEERGWRLRELRQPTSVLEVLKEGGEILLLKLGRDLYEELALLEQVTWLFPETATVVLGATDHPELAALAWDLGARFVLLPPLTADYLPELVSGLMKPEMPQAR